MSQVTRIPSTEHGINPREIDKKARTILTSLTKAGYEAYLVGGGVRDLLLGYHPKDFDIATSATPEQVKQVLPSTRIIGRRFRLAHVHFGREYFEVATFRAPHDNSDKGQVGDHGRIINDNVYGTVVEDAYRRDFSINALFYDLETGEVLDFVGGMDDLKKLQLRMIGDPVVRYREDPVRMIRAVRFAAKLNLTIEPASEAPIYELSSLLGNIAPARLFDETLKLFHGGMAVKTLELLRHYHLLEHLFPQAEKGLAEEAGEGSFTNLVYAALNNTDKRIRSGKPVTPAFLFAVMLWKQVKEGAEMYRDLGNPALQSVHLAATDAFAEQVKCISVPRRFSNMTREIWTMQGRFQFKNTRRVMGFLDHRRFRAAYDFMCLRAQAGEIMPDDCEWWTLIQEVDEQEKIAMCQASSSPKKKGKGNRTGRRNKRS
ncbi:MAG: polynucleotide adenylyltransferase PcnB [Cocleimonas sp.]|nr:polynucleotide adenylyltransferase PcnB [Cocleimonas sp.]